MKERDLSALIRLGFSLCLQSISLGMDFSSLARSMERFVLTNQMVGYMLFLFITTKHIFIVFVLVRFRRISGFSLGFSEKCIKSNPQLKYNTKVVMIHLEHMVGKSCE